MLGMGALVPSADGLLDGELLDPAFLLAGRDDGGKGRIPSDGMARPFGTFDGAGPGADMATQLAAAVDWSNSEGGKRVILPKGKIYTSATIPLKKFTRLEGIGDNANFASVIEAIPGSGEPIFGLAPGPVIRNALSRICIQGVGNADQVAIRFEGVPIVNAKPQNGGLWHSLFDEVTIQGFKAPALDFRGGATGLLPNQFTVFYRMQILAPSDYTGEILRFTRQTGQLHFVSCMIQGADPQSLLCTLISAGRLFSSTDGVNTVYGSHLMTAPGPGWSVPAAVDQVAPGNVVFTDCTFQNFHRAFQGQLAGNFIFRGGWYENGHGVWKAENMKGLVISDFPLVGNCTSDGSGGGFLIDADSNSIVSAEVQLNGGAIDSLTKGGAAYKKRHIMIGYTSPQGKTSGSLRQLSVSAAVGFEGELNISSHRVIALNTNVSGTGAGTVNALKKLIANHTENVTLIALGNLVIDTTVLAVDGGNLELTENLATIAKDGLVAMRAGDILELYWYDLPGDPINHRWRLRALHRNTKATARPSAGYYLAGERVEYFGTADATLHSWTRLSAGIAVAGSGDDANWRENRFAA